MPTPRKYQTDAERQAAYRQRQAEARHVEQQAKGLPLLPAVPTIPGTARWKALRDQAQALLETMLDEMQRYYDDRSEQWQESDRGEEFQERIDQVDIARAAVEEITATNQNAA